MAAANGGSTGKKSQIALEFIIIYTLILVIFMIVFALIATQKANTISSQQALTLQLAAQKVAANINYALAAGSGYSVTAPFAASILNNKYNIYISSEGAILANMSVGGQIITGQAFSAARQLVVNGTLMPSSTNSISLFQLPTSSGQISITNYHGTIYVDTPPPSASNLSSVASTMAYVKSFANFLGNNYIDTSMSMNVPSSGWTEAMWVNVAANSLGWCTDSTHHNIAFNDRGVAGTGNSLTVGTGVYQGVSGGFPFFFGWDGTGNTGRFATSNAIYNYNTWYFVAGTYNSSYGFTLYVNGSKAGYYTNSGTYGPGSTCTTGALASTYNSPNAWTIGREGSFYFNGSIANIQVYNAPLSANQITQLYQGGINSRAIISNSLIVWWPLNYTGKDFSNHGYVAGVSNGGVYSSNVIIVSHATLINSSNSSGALFGAASSTPNMNGVHALARTTNSNGIAQLWMTGNLAVESNATVNLLNTELPLSSNIVRWLPLIGGYNGSVYGFNRSGVSNGIFQNPQWPMMPGNSTRMYVAGFNALSARNEHVSVSANAVNTTAGGYNTVSFWMRWNGTAGIPFGFSAYDLYFGSGCLGFSTGAGDVYGTSFTPLIKKWVFVTAEFYNGAYTGNSLLYLNGVPQTLTQCAAPASSGGAANSFYISGNSALGGNYFNGSIANVQVYNTTLAGKDIGTLYSEGIMGIPLAGRHLITWLPFDNSTASYSSYAPKVTAANVVFAQYFNTSTGKTSVAYVNGGKIYGGSTPFASLGYSFSINQWFMLANLTSPYSGVLGGASPIADIYNRSNTNPLATGQNLDFGGTWAGGSTGIFAYGFGSTWCSTQPGTIVPNTWYNAMVSVTNYNSVTIYVNGEKEASCSFALAEPSGGIISNLVFGAGTNLVGNSAESANAYIADVEIYSTATSQAQASEMYTGGMPPTQFINLTGWS